MLACALVARGVSAEAAIDRVRTMRPYSIETVEQEECVRDYAEVVAKRAKGSIIRRSDEKDGTKDDNKPADNVN